MTHRTLPVAAVSAAIVGCAVLVVRPVLLDDTSHPVALLVGLFALLGAAALLWPERVPSPTAAMAGVLVAGTLAFAAGRLLGGRPPGPPTLQFVALNSLAAVAEELFFRRLVYGLLVASGPAYAILGSATLFAVVHVTTYGWWVLPIDLAAGVVLGWQRWTSSTWLVPAATHVLANVFVVV